MKTIEAEEISTIPTGKLDRNEILGRKERVMELLCCGYSPYQICQVTKNWGISQRQIYNYVKHCEKKVKQYNNKNFNEIRAWHIEKNKYVLKQFMDEKDWRGSLVALRDLGELQGIRQGDIFPLSPTEERKRLELVKTKLFEMNPKLTARPSGISEFEVK